MVVGEDDCNVHEIGHSLKDVSPVRVLTIVEKRIVERVSRRSLPPSSSSWWWKKQTRFVPTE